MKTHIRVTFEREDVETLVKDAYIEQFGPPPKGFALQATHNYGEYTVEMYEKEKEDDERISSAGNPEGGTTGGGSTGEAPAQAPNI